MTKPMIRKNGDVWQVIIRDRAWNTRATWTDALTHGNRIATYARQIRIQRDINRIHASLERIKERTMSSTCRLCGSRDGWHKWSCTNLPPCGNPAPDPCEKCSCKRAKESR